MGKEVDLLDQTKAVPLSSVKDGSYSALSETALIKAEVSVTVEDHRIISISILKHDNGKGKDAEKTVESMMEENTSEVEIIRGATASRLVIR